MVWENGAENHVGQSYFLIYLGWGTVKITTILESNYEATNLGFIKTSHQVLFCISHILSLLQLPIISFPIQDAPNKEICVYAE
jgi:hypothetical protein